MHWSGEHCHECFIRKAMSEPNPLDDDPLMRELHELTMEFYTRAMLPRSTSRKDSAYLPSHYSGD